MSHAGSILTPNRLLVVGGVVLLTVVGWLVTVGQKQAERQGRDVQSGQPNGTAARNHPVMTTAEVYEAFGTTSGDFPSKLTRQDDVQRVFGQGKQTDWKVTGDNQRTQLATKFAHTLHARDDEGGIEILKRADYIQMEYQNGATRFV